MLVKRSDFQRTAIIVVLTAGLMWALLYAPTPYVIYEPGIATPVEPMMTIEEGDDYGKGSFLLTAVRLTEPNFIGVIKSTWDPDADVRLKSDIFRGYSEEQYIERLSVIMQGSQNNAIEAAYRYAGVPYKTVTQSIVISDVSAKKSSSNMFHAGDRLLGIDNGVRFTNIGDMLLALKKLNRNDQVTFDIERNGEQSTVTIAGDAIHSSLTAEELPKALGLKGLTELQSLQPNDSSKRLLISAEDIGGPSAGLVFALQALDLLTEGDLTGGTSIAATGTISVDGKVGAIGGIKQKIVIASKEGAQIFLVPSDNYREAKAKAEALGTAMQIVSVHTLSEAIESIRTFNGTKLQ